MPPRTSSPVAEVIEATLRDLERNLALVHAPLVHIRITVTFPDGTVKQVDAGRLPSSPPTSALYIPQAPSPQTIEAARAAFANGSLQEPSFAVPAPEPAKATITVGGSVIESVKEFAVCPTPERHIVNGTGVCASCDRECGVCGHMQSEHDRFDGGRCIRCTCPSFRSAKPGNNESLTKQRKEEAEW